MRKTEKEIGQMLAAQDYEVEVLDPWYSQGRNIHHEMYNKCITTQVCFIWICSKNSVMEYFQYSKCWIGMLSNIEKINKKDKEKLPKV